MNKNERIKFLEDALVDARGKLFHQFGDMELDPPGKDDCRIVREMLQAEGKIGPDADAKPHCWQITEERRDAIMKMSSIRTIIFCPDCGASMEFIDIVEPMAVLRGMLEEAE